MSLRRDIRANVGFVKMLETNVFEGQTSQCRICKRCWKQMSLRRDIRANVGFVKMFETNVFEEGHTSQCRICKDVGNKCI